MRALMMGTFIVVDSVSIVCERLTRKHVLSETRCPRSVVVIAGNHIVKP